MISGFWQRCYSTLWIPVDSFLVLYKKGQKHSNSLLGLAAFNCVTVIKHGKEKKKNLK